jgi:hypothetical protein
VSNAFRIASLDATRLSNAFCGPTVCEVPDQTVIVGAGAIGELQAPQEPSGGGGHRFSVSDGSDRLAVTARLFAKTSGGERLVAAKSAMAIGLWRLGTGACQGSREFPRCDHGNSPPGGRPVSAGRSALMASRWRRMR